MPHTPLCLSSCWYPLPAFCPRVPTATSLTISSCQISPVTSGQVPAHIAPPSVSSTDSCLVELHRVTRG
ncbi:hypothetical protein CgunFtcFv8_001690 [Champsocephalus gunnari]|uniref:Uncharacterized protein n=1 Tax=Champsocephalus gunnari TaxID=52237 RepID=A0AAN8CP55_CHAGU|nr:hypothetical protein CgunFtcFv8_001690 [Champsocephalus gunnari]